MLKEYKNLLTARQCEHIAAGMINCLNRNGLVVETTPFNPGCLGKYDLEEGLDLVPFLHKKIAADYGRLSFKNCYARIYRNGNYLKCHTDRPGLDVTLSICVYSDVDHLWPMHFSNVSVTAPWNTAWTIDMFNSSFQSFDTDVGDGIACLGTKTPHWRDTLHCKEGQKIIQIFYHWGLQS